MARHLARVRALAAGESEPSPLLYQTALRDVIGHCLYGVDINPMAVELCKVTLWLEALEPGKPLSFLDHHIRCGNSLLGATPELISAGLPDEAFDPIEGDDKAACSSLKKLNRAQREGLRHLFIAEDNAIRDRLRQTASAIEEMSDSRPEDIRRKEAAFRAAQSNYDFQKAWDLANLWCAAFVVKKHFPGGASEISNLQSQVASPLGPTVTQAGLFGGTEEAPKAKAKKAKAPSRASSEVPIGITTQHIRDFVEGGALPDGLLAESKRQADQYQFFQWHLAFPEVFAQAGFDLSLGNPPWERVKLQEREWFAERRPDIADAPNAAARKELIRRLKAEEPELDSQFKEAARQSEGESHFLRNSGAFPLCGRGDINLYAVFAEKMNACISTSGRAGFIVPSGIATDESTKDFFSTVVRSLHLVSIYDFENRENLFPGIGHGRMKFSLVTLGPAASARFAFQLWNVNNLREPDRLFELTGADIELLNPNTLTCPIFRTSHEAEITKSIYRRIPVFVREGASEVNPWQVSFQRMFDMTNDAALFRDAQSLDAEGFKLTGSTYANREGGCFIPLYEAKMACHYDHRFGTFEGRHEDRESSALDTPTAEQHQNPSFAVLPRYWVTEGEVADFRWMLTLRAISHATNDRSFIAQVIPRSAVGNSLVCVQSKFSGEESLLYGNFCSFAFDFIVRQKIGGLNLNFFIVKQLPVLTPAVYAEPCAWTSGGKTLKEWLLPRVLELTYTAWDLEAFAQDCGWSGPPFRWDEERRFLLRCELDAAFFHLYLGLEAEWRQQPAALTRSFPAPRDAVSYIMDTFPIVKRKDEAKFNGDYRTKRTILEVYDALAEAINTDKPYQTRLDPPPADARCCHSPKQAAIPKAIQPPSLQEVVAGFDFALPSRRRPHINTPAELHVTLIPALVQEAGGRLDYAELLEAMTFLTAPPASAVSLPTGAASVFGLWRSHFPSSLVDPMAFQAALHDLIVMRHALNIRPEETGHLIFKGIQWTDITFDWTLVDAKMALSHAAAVGVVSKPWLDAVPEETLKHWAAA